MKPTHTDQYLHYSSRHQTSCKESGFSSLFNRAYSIITNNDDSRIEQVLKENEYQESIIIKIFKRLLTIAACLSHNKKTQALDIQEEEIRMRSE